MLALRQCNASRHGARNLVSMFKSSGGSPTCKSISFRNQHQPRHVHLSPSIGGKQYSYGGDNYIPEAYRRQEQNVGPSSTRKRRKGDRRRDNQLRHKGPHINTKSRLKQSSKSIKSNLVMNEKQAAAMKKVKSEIESLYTIERDAWEMIQSYEKMLGIRLDLNDDFQFLSNYHSPSEHLSLPDNPIALLFQSLTTDYANDSETPSVSSLVESEALFASTCAKLRQLIAGWTAIRIKDANLIYGKVLRDQHGKQQFYPLRTRESGPIPPERAIYFLSVLEKVRQQRSDSIKRNKDELESLSSTTRGQIIAWFGELFSSKSNRTNDDDDDESIDDFDRLRAHISPSCTCTTLLYSEVMKSFFDWRNFLVYDDDGFVTTISNIPNSKREQSKSRMRRRIHFANLMESIILSMNQSFRSNPNTCPDIHVYHHLLRAYTLINDLKYAQKALETVHCMESKKKKRENDNKGKDLLSMIKADSVSPSDLVAAGCFPTITSYNHALTAFMQSARYAKSDKTKLRALETIEQVISKLVRRRSVSQAHPNVSQGIVTDEKSSLSNGPSTESYALALLTMKDMSTKNVPDLCQRAEDIMKKMMGNDAYHKHIHDGESLAQRIDSKVLHFLFEIYSASDDPSYLLIAKSLLIAIEEANSVNKHDKKADEKSNYLNVRKYNKFIKKIHDNVQSKVKSMKGNESNVLFIAPQDTEMMSIVLNECNYATGLLESMISNGVIPDRHTFHTVMRTWFASGLKEAGVRSSTILSQMKALSTFLPDIEPDSKSYEIALKCWVISAATSEKNAASQTLLLLDRMESMMKDEGSYPIEHHFELAIQACSTSNLSDDKENAMAIAFDIYNRMMDRDMIPSSYAFQRLLWCTTFFDTPDHTKTMQLSETVFNAATANDRVNESVLSMLRKVNPLLHERYTNQNRSD